MDARSASCVGEVLMADQTPDDRLAVGDRINFASEKRCYTVQATDGRYAVCTKPFAACRTVMYTIVDLEEEIRGTEDLIFGFGFGTRQECEEALERLRAGDSGISRRNRVPLDIVEVRKP